MIEEGCPETHAHRRRSPARSGARTVFFTPLGGAVPLVEFKKLIDKDRWPRSSVPTRFVS